MISIIASVVFAFIIFTASRWIIRLAFQVATALFQLMARLIGIIALIGVIAWLIVSLVQH